MSGGLQLSHGKTNEGKRMNLSIETKLATALGASFVALVLGAMAQTQNDSGTAGANEYALRDNPALTNPSREGFTSSSSRGTTQEDARTSLSNDTGRLPVAANGKKKFKSVKHESKDAGADHSYDD
jgi:hypothetical protein